MSGTLGQRGKDKSGRVWLAWSSHGKRGQGNLMLGLVMTIQDGSELTDRSNQHVKTRQVQTSQDIKD